MVTNQEIDRLIYRIAESNGPTEARTGVREVLEETDLVIKARAVAEAFLAWHETSDVALDDETLEALSALCAVLDLPADAPMTSSRDPTNP
jgi:hypothetical protein